MDLQTLIKETELFEREYHDPCERVLRLWRASTQTLQILLHGMEDEHGKLDRAKSKDIEDTIAHLSRRIYLQLSPEQQKEVNARWASERELNPAVHIPKDELC